jgi:hypothetical protein
MPKLSHPFIQRNGMPFIYQAASSAKAKFKPIAFSNTKCQINKYGEVSNISMR